MEGIVHFGHVIAQIKKADVVPGLEGELRNIRESSAQMSISRMASLIEMRHGLRRC